MERKAEKESQVYVVSARDNFETMGYSTSVIWNIISGESAHFKEFASICRVFFSLLRRMVQKGCGIFSVAQMDYVTAGRDWDVPSGGFAASASGHPMEVKRRGWTAVWIGRSCNSSYRAAVCRIFATLRGIVKRLLRACHACNRSNGWNSTQIGSYEVHVYDFIVVDFTHSYCVDCQSVLSSNM